MTGDAPPDLSRAILKPVVLQLIDSFEQGGSESQAVKLSGLLHESGRFRVQLACLNPNGPLRAAIESLELGEIPSYPLTAFYDLNAFRQLRSFVRFLKRSKVDVLHTHDFYTNIFGMVGGALARVPVRIASRRETTSMRSRLQARTQGFAYSLSHQIVANCEAVLSQLVAEGISRHKIAVIYNGLDLRRFTATANPTRAASLAAVNVPTELQNRPIVTMVANMRLAVKDHSTFLRAARRVCEAVPATAFLLAGEGELLSRVRAEAEREGIASNLFFLGRCESLPELLAISDVCVLTSRSEGFSNAILEYMAAGRPVVATDVGGAREAVVEGETGYLVDPGNDQVIAERIVALLRAPEKARAMGQAGYHVVDQKFSFEAQLLNTEALYERLLAFKEREASSVVDGVSQENA